MSNLPEVPTDDLLSFQDYPAVHGGGNLHTSSGQFTLNLAQSTGGFQEFHNDRGPKEPSPLEDGAPEAQKLTSFWTWEYYQQLFDVDTKDVMERILASVTPRRGSGLKNHLRDKPDLYGPFWISITLVFTIAISGNIANYLQHMNEQYHWKYDFHLVSYAASAICLYVTLIPFTLWGLLKWSSDVADLDGLEDGKTPGALELICIYGYSLFIYIPVSILWTIQVNFVQWILMIFATVISGSVLLFTLLPALRLSRHKILLIVGIISCHFLLAAGFVMYFFHVPGNNNAEHKTTAAIVSLPTNASNTTNSKIL